MKKFILLIALMLVCGIANATDYCASAVGCWLFKEGSGTTVEDSSPNTNTGNFKGSGEPAWDTTDVPFGTSGSAPNSVDFDTTDDYISVEDHTSLAPSTTWTYGAWVKVDSNSDIYTIFSHWNDSGGGRQIYIYVVNGKVWVDIPYVANILNDGGSSLGTTSWRHVAVTRNGSSWVIYLDGTYDQTATNSTTQENSTEAMEIGYSNSASYSAFGGTMTEAFQDDTALTSTDISAIYDFGLQPTEVATSKTHTFGNITVLGGSGTISF